MLHSVKLVKSLFLKSSNDIYYTFLHLRPCELSNTIFAIKILKKYDRLPCKKTIVSFESALIKLFEKTPYPFIWDIKYNDKCEYMCRMKKVLFYYKYD